MPWEKVSAELSAPNLLVIHCSCKTLKLQLLLGLMHDRAAAQLCSGLVSTSCNWLRWLWKSTRPSSLEYRQPERIRMRCSHALYICRTLETSLQSCFVQKARIHSKFVHAMANQGRH